MSLRALLALAVLLAAAVAALVWVDHRQKPKDASPADEPFFAAFTEDALRGIELTCEGAPVTLARDAAGRWRITQPSSAEADPRRVRELVSGLQEARARKVIAEGVKELGGFGLDPAACAARLTFAAGRDPATLRLGRSSPVGTERYATGDGTSVRFADGSLYTLLARGADALREKRLIPVEADAITRITLERPDGPVAIVKNGDAWRMVAPFADAAGGSACNNLARAVATLAVDKAAIAPAPAVVRPDRRIRLEVAATGVPMPIVAYLATSGIESTRLGWREGGALTGLVPESPAHELEAAPESFRETRIASFSTTDVRRVGVDRGGAQLAASRATESAPWTATDGKVAIPLDGSRIDTLLDRLRGLSGAGFTPGPPATPATGTLRVEGEKGDLLRMTFGPLPRQAGSDEELLWVTTPARPGVVFRMPAANLGPIPASPADWAPVAPAKAGATSTP